MNPSLARYAWLSLGAALSTMALKTVAYLLTGSVGLLSDAAESLVNLAAALFALWAIRVAESPPDEGHPHGHEKVEYFSSGLEGMLIVAAAIAIAVTAVPRLLAPRPLQSLTVGLMVSLIATALNFACSRVLMRAGRRHRSAALTADATHLMSDVWTSVAVVAGVALVGLTGILWLDPVAALLMAVYISWTGGRLVYQAGMALMDASLPKGERDQIHAVLERFREQGIDFHALRTRQAGRRRFVSFHVLVPGEWTVKRGHDLLERIEAEVRKTAPRTTVMTHLEPREDPAAYHDQGLDR